MKILNVVIPSLTALAVGGLAGYFIGRKQKTPSKTSGTMFINYACDGAPELYLGDLDSSFLKKPSGIIRLRVICVKDNGRK